MWLSGDACGPEGLMFDATNPYILIYISLF